MRLLKLFQNAHQTPGAPPKKEDYEANPNHPGNPNEDYEEVFHFSEDADPRGAGILPAALALLPAQASKARPGGASAGVFAGEIQYPSSV